MEKFKKLFGIENKKLPITKEFLLGLFSLVALETNAQNEIHKHYSANEINSLKLQAKEIIDQLKAGTDSTVVGGNKLVWNIKQNPDVGNVVRITETRKDGTVIEYMDGVEILQSSTAPRVEPSNGFPLVAISSPAKATVVATQSKLERIAENGTRGFSKDSPKGPTNFTEDDFTGQRVSFVTKNEKGKVGDDAEVIELSPEESKDFIGGYVAQYKDDLAIIRSAQVFK